MGGNTGGCMGGCLQTSALIISTPRVYGLRTSLAEEVKGQMSIVTVFTRRFGPI